MWGTEPRIRRLNKAQEPVFHPKTLCRKSAHCENKSWKQKVPCGPAPLPCYLHLPVINRENLRQNTGLFFCWKIKLEVCLFAERQMICMKSQSKKLSNFSFDDDTKGEWQDLFSKSEMTHLELCWSRGAGKAHCYWVVFRKQKNPFVAKSSEYHQKKKTIFNTFLQQTAQRNDLGTSLLWEVIFGETKHCLLWFKFGQTSEKTEHLDS